MPTESLDHYSVRTRDVAGVVDFYASTLGLVCGPRPSFTFSGAWLYRTDQERKPTGRSLVHVIGNSTEQTSGLNDFLGNKAAHARQDTGSLDHIAFRASNIAAMYQTLEKKGLVFRERRVPGMPLHLLFVEDPSGVTIELNYTSDEDLAAADLHLTDA